LTETKGGASDMVRLLYGAFCAITRQYVKRAAPQAKRIAALCPAMNASSKIE